jgi:hypothetical protein
VCTHGFGLVQSSGAATSIDPRTVTVAPAATVAFGAVKLPTGSGNQKGAAAVSEQQSQALETHLDAFDSRGTPALPASSARLKVTQTSAEALPSLTTAAEAWRTAASANLGETGPLSQGVPATPSCMFH